MRFFVAIPFVDGTGLHETGSEFDVTEEKVERMMLAGLIATTNDRAVRIAARECGPQRPGDKR